MSARAGPESLPAADLERFQIRSRIEIHAILQMMIERRIAVTVQFGDANELATSVLLAADPGRDELVFDCSGDAAANARLLRSPQIAIAASLDRIRVQFHSRQPEAAVYRELPAIRVQFPDTLLRFQRRDYFRVSPALQAPLVVRVPDPGGAGARELRVLDISCGGVAVAVAPKTLALRTGMVLSGCVLALPEGVVNFRAEVRSVAAGAAPGGADRCGLGFKNLPPAASQALQRHVLQLERERRARL